MIILEPQSKWWSLATSQLVFSDVCLINFFHISRMAFISCNRQKWSLSWRAYSVFKMFQFLIEPSEWNSWVIKLTQQTFVLMKTSWRRLSSSSSEDVFKTPSRRLDQDEYILLIVAKSHGLGVRLTENYLIQQLTPEMKKLP